MFPIPLGRGYGSVAPKLNTAQNAPKMENQNCGTKEEVRTKIPPPPPNSLRMSIWHSAVGCSIGPDKSGWDTGSGRVGTNPIVETDPYCTNFP